MDARAVPQPIATAVDCGRFIVHGHTPLRTGTPDLRKRRVNLDTAAVIGGPLTAAVFDDTQRGAAGVPDRARARSGGRLAAVMGTARAPTAFRPDAGRPPALCTCARIEAAPGFESA